MPSTLEIKIGQLDEIRLDFLAGRLTVDEAHRKAGEIREEMAEQYPDLMANYVPENAGNRRRGVLLMIIALTNAIKDKIPYAVLHRGYFISIALSENGWWGFIGRTDVHVGTGHPVETAATYKEAIQAAERAIDEGLIA